MLSVEVGSRVWQRAFIVLIMFLGTVILLTFPQYGITSDEASHMSYGEDIVTWYWSGFEDHSVFEYKNTWLYGGVLDTVVHLAGQVLPFDVYDTRHLCNALVGLLGVVAAYFLGSLLVVGYGDWNKIAISFFSQSDRCSDIERHSATRSHNRIPTCRKRGS